MKEVRWSYSLMRETSPVLLDENIDLKYKVAIKEKIESDADNHLASRRPQPLCCHNMPGIAYAENAGLLQRALKKTTNSRILQLKSIRE